MRRQTTLPPAIGPREILVLAWPILVSMLSFTATLVVDSLFVARLGEAPLAALGVAAPAVFLLFSFALGVARAVKVLTAQRLGAGDHDAVGRLLPQAIVLSLAMGAVLATLSPLGGALFAALGVDGGVIAHAAPYFAARALSAPAVVARVAISGWFEGQGDTRTPMVSTLTTNVANLLLDPIFIFGWGAVPAMGTAGAGWATGLAELLGLLAFVPSARAMWAGSLRPDRALLRAVYRLGAPLGVRSTLEVGAWLGFVSFVARAGPEHLAAHAVVLRVVSVSFLPGHAVGEAGAVFVGQALGAGRPDLAVQAWRAAARVAVGLMGLFAGLFVAAPEVLLAPFAVSGDTLVLGRELLVLAALFQVVDALAMVGQAVLTGAGDTRFVMVSSVALAWGVQLPLAWVLAVGMGLGAPGAWTALSLVIGSLAALTLWRLRSGRWADRAPATVS